MTFNYTTPTEIKPAKPDALLRQARSIVNELWRLNNAHFPIYNQASPSIRHLNALLSQATLQLTARLILLDKLSGQRKRKRQKVDALSSELRNQISRIQNPPDCRRSRFILAELRIICGLGCVSHHMALKLSYAFANNRTMLLQHNDWKDFFLPLSNCSQRHAESQSKIELIKNGLPNKGKLYNPPAMPREWSERLSDAVGDPFPWYRGHLLGYILRPAHPDLRQAIEMELQNIRRGLHGEVYDGPIASIHVRRTDKLIKEAKSHAVEEYMFHVERFFDLKEMEYSLETGSVSPPAWSSQRRVFMASDDASAFQEAKSKYPRYDIIGQLRNGSIIKRRSSAEGVFAITVDLYLLVAADFLVCTGSSNICRLAYELFSTKSQTHGDAVFQMQSVDWMYECTYTRKRWWRAIADFKQEGVKLGDHVSILSTRWDGFVQTAPSLHGTRETVLPAYLFQEIVQCIW
ncbi:unnamed protein product [Schistocephalus solidus]|uniref:GT23 domain-containing protein n=1 Tax=Schistocephalus solidus TaxID=70667 RepID=A0A183TNC7_SCHSO|nr:unnamed protein product [Schistocephalus solidus]